MYHRWDHSDVVHYCRICYFRPDQVLHLSSSNTASTVHLHHLFLHGQRNRGRSIDTDDTLHLPCMYQTFNTITSISIQMASLVAKIKVTSRNNCQWLFCIFCPRPLMRKGTNRFNDQGWWSQRCSYYIPYTISYILYSKGAHTFTSTKVLIILHYSNKVCFSDKQFSNTNIKQHKLQTIQDTDYKQ